MNHDQRVRKAANKTARELFTSLGPRGDIRGTQLRIRRGDEYVAGWCGQAAASLIYSMMTKEGL